MTDVATVMLWVGCAVCFVVGVWQWKRYGNEPWSVAGTFAAGLSGATFAWARQLKATNAPGAETWSWIASGLILAPLFCLALQVRLNQRKAPLEGPMATGEDPPPLATSRRRI